MRWLRSLVLIGLLVAGSARSVEAAWALDAAWAASSGAASATTLAHNMAAVSANSILICFVTGGHQTSGVVTGITDSVNGGAWTQFTAPASPINTGGLSVALSAWYFLNSAAGTPTVTATFTATVVNRGMVCGSYTGIRTAGAYDVGAGQGEINCGAACNTGATGATAEANELAVAMVLTQDIGTVTEGGGWTERYDAALGVGSYRVQVEDQNIAAPAAVDGTWTMSNGGNDIQAIVGTFKEPAAAGSCTGGLLLLGAGKCE
jgi:hypothetical protein